jgi:hypothetical protein
MQIAIDRSLANIVSSLLILVSSTVTIQYLRLAQAFRRVPLSSFSLLGFCITTQWGALILHSLSGTAVAGHLRDPLRTFALLGAFQGIAIAAHATFSNLRLTMSARRVVTERLLVPLGLFTVPNALQLWVMGLAGTGASYVTHTGFEHGVGDKILAGFSYFCVAPVLIPLFRRRYGAAYCDLRVHTPALLAYLLTFVAVGIATNARVLVFSAAVAAGVIHLLFALDDQRPIDHIGVSKLIGIIAIAILSLNFTADLATAMLIGRAYRDRSHTQWDVIEETVDALRHPDKIAAYRDQDEAKSFWSRYDETYFDNQVLGRIVETKYHDNMFFFSRDVSPQDWLLVRDQVTARLWGILPAPVLERLRIPVDKRQYQYSMGDFWIELKYGKGVGGYATGSMLADGMALFGSWFCLIYFVLCLFLFLGWEVLVRTRGAEVRISVVALLMSVQLFQYGITAQSFDSLPAFIVRGLAQNIVLYLILFWGTRIVLPRFAGGDGVGAA